ncbi:MAG: hypothetical protein ACLGIA_03075 [Actinomycetes bacterium]
MSRITRALLVVAAASSLTVACTGGPSSPASQSKGSPDAPSATLHRPADPVGVVASAPDAAATAVATTQALFETAPVVVTAPVDDVPDQLRAASAAVALGAPLLLSPATANQGVAAELDRLGPDAVLAFGPAGRAGSASATAHGPEVVQAPADDAALADLLRRDLGPVKAVQPEAATPAVAALDPVHPTLLNAAPATTASPTGKPTAESGGGELPKTSAPEPLSDVLVLTSGAPQDLAAVASARAAGAAVQVVPSGDPRAQAETVTAISGAKPQHVLALGPVFGDVATLTNRLAVVRTGLQLPGGGQTVFPGRRLVALYGHPGTPSLGVLGEQPVDQAVKRAQQVAAPYQPLSDRPVIPAFEIIATVASNDGGNMSNEVDPEKLRPWVEAARDNGIFVVLDLQPGTSHFLEQAKLYETLLREPNVGLALDPEWRLKPGQRHLAQIGSVDAAEINEVSAWLAELTRTHNLPQKLFVLHQFRLSMITHRDTLVPHDELATVIHADGNGTPSMKIATWNAIRGGAQDWIWWGWKNFYDEDKPTFTPAQTYQLTPVPDLVSYQ